jgi:hypothetical protein
LESIILAYELSSIGTHTLIGRAISPFLKMETKCFRNNAKLQPMRRNFFYNWELWKHTGSFIGNKPLCKCNFGHINGIFLQAMLLVGVPFNFGADRNQLHEMDLGTPCGHRRHTLDVKKN